MQDTEFYERLLGLSQPWKVTDVAMDVAAGEVRVKVACDGIRRCGELGFALGGTYPSGWGWTSWDVWSVIPLKSGTPTLLRS